MKTVRRCTREWNTIDVVGKQVFFETTCPRVQNRDPCCRSCLSLLGLKKGLVVPLLWVRQYLLEHDVSPRQSKQAEFMDAGTRVEHPFDGPQDISDEVTRRIFVTVTEGPAMTAKRLIAKIQGERQGVAEQIPDH